MKAILIARVSTLDQADALPGQIYRLKDYAARKGYEYSLFEIKESAYKGDRASFQEVIAKVTSMTEPCIVVFDKIDRYTRNSNSTEVGLLNTLCRSGQIEIHFPSDHLYINKNSSAQEHFMLNMGVSNAQYYSDAISDNVKRRNQQKWRDGEWCGKAPIGYVNTVRVDGKKWIEPDPSSSHIVIEAFEMYASGNSSLREIAKLWRDKYGYKSTSSSRIDQLLKNPFYYGEMRVMGNIYPHKYNPIISRSLFEKARSVREGYQIKPHRWGGLPFAYRGLITCAECGCRITFETKKQKYTYGHCTRKKNKHPLKYVNENEITKQIKELTRRIQIPAVAFHEISTILRESHETKKKSYENQSQLIDAQIQKYQQRKEKVYEDYLDGKIAEDFYERKFKEFDVQVKLKQEQRESLELSSDEYYLGATHLLKLAKELPTLFEKADPAQKRSILNIIVSNLELDGDLLRWKYKKPFDTMALCNESLNWLPLVDALRNYKTPVLGTA